MRHQLDAAAVNFEKLEEKSAATLKKAEMNGKKVVKRWKAFNDACASQHTAVMDVCDNREFLRDLLLKAKLLSFDPETLIKSNACDPLTEEFPKLERLATKKFYANTLDNILKKAWLVQVLSKFKSNDAGRKSLPASCCKFISVLLQIVMLGWEVTHDVFYTVLDKTINLVPDDHSKLSVHKVLVIVRESLNIGHDQFLRYLNSLHIPACPELLAKIRSIKKSKTKRPPVMAGAKIGKQRSLAAISEDDAAAVEAAAAVVTSHEQFRFFLWIKRWCSFI